MCLTQGYHIVPFKAQNDDFFIPQSNYNPSEDPHLEDAGYKILGASSAEHSNDIDYHTATQKPISARSNDSEHSVGA